MSRVGKNFVLTTTHALSLTVHQLSHMHSRGGFLRSAVLVSTAAQARGHVHGQNHHELQRPAGAELRPARGVQNVGSVSGCLPASLCVCLLFPSPVLFGQTLSLQRCPARGVQNVGSASGCLSASVSVFSLRPHCCLVRLFLCTAALLLLACFSQSNGLKNAMQM